jgi:uncharacterized protein YkwD
MQRMIRHTPCPTRSVLAIAIALTTPLTSLAALSAAPAVLGAALPPATTSTIPTSPAQTTVEGYVLTWVNADRVARGLRPLRLDSDLRSVARERAGALASLGVLSHTAAGDLSAQLAAAHIQDWSWGEDIGWTTYRWGYDAARSLFLSWKGSAPHWALLMSSTFNYVGIGLGYRSADQSTYAVIDLTESRDHTAPGKKMIGRGRSGSTIWFTWRGADVSLQTHTSGLKNFDVEFRRDDGAWRIIRSGTSATSIRLASRVAGHQYYLRVRARDRAGNVSDWSGSLHVLVP